MLKYELTSKLRDLIKELGLNPDQIDNVLSKEYITQENLVRFYRARRPTKSLLQLISLTKLVVDKNEPEKQPKSKEFLKSIELLRLKAKEAEYQALVNPAPQFKTLYETNSKDKSTAAQAVKETKSHVTTIFNVLVSVASVVYAIWYWTDSSWKLSNAYRVLLCLFFGMLVLVAEVVVYLGYLNKIEEARIKERSKKEIKKVIKTL
ncbi:Vacuolar ATPase assembly integral membrane protein [Scheffersomyces spartinae]|uniref:Vacuolar ATPase assembly integral membrane protein n=1 Tax=Scheffersomyces spartinae TaxID=45513 RepID=A0A9P7V9X8_9ASCO|nr:Vacuolar ATPase assembly integral membrane protein [Scheffersomyces spartinae]KAG7194052.1 Vacuolar ATPase assembly integral membrane protein [Scheffersomyces spartinae]